MVSVIRKLYAGALVLAALASASYYLGTRAAQAGVAANAQPECVMCFGAGDELKILGGLLLVVALALAFAATMLWLRERREAEPPVRLTS